MLRRNGEAAALLEIYRLLEAAYDGERWHWMPGQVRGPFDVIAGAILVQHTTWTNAERALERLRAADALTPRGILGLTDDQLADLVRVSGTPVVKARRLRAIAETAERAGGLAALLALPREALRAVLLATHGVGPETAAAIALYAAGHPVFEVDAYTRRIFRRIGLGPDGDAYDGWQRWFEDALAPQAGTELFQRFHAYIVLHGKAVCRPAPRCGACALQAVCAYGSSTTQV